MSHLSSSLAARVTAMSEEEGTGTSPTEETISDQNRGSTLPPGNVGEHFFHKFSLVRLSRYGQACTWRLSTPDWLAGSTVLADAQAAHPHRSQTLSALRNIVVDAEDDLFVDLRLNDGFGIACSAFQDRQAELAPNKLVAFRHMFLLSAVSDRAIWASSSESNELAEREISLQPRSQHVPHDVPTDSFVTRGFAVAVTNFDSTLKDFIQAYAKDKNTTSSGSTSSNDGVSSSIANLDSHQMSIVSLIRGASTSKSTALQATVKANLCEAALALAALSTYDKTSNSTTDTLSLANLSDRNSGLKAASKDSTFWTNRLRDRLLGGKESSKELQSLLEDKQLKDLKDLELLRPLYSAVAFTSVYLLGQYVAAPKGKNVVTLQNLAAAPCYPSYPHDALRESVEKDVWNIVLDLAARGADQYDNIVSPCVERWTRALEARMHLPEPEYPTRESWNSDYQEWLNGDSFERRAQVVLENVVQSREQSAGIPLNRPVDVHALLLPTSTDNSDDTRRDIPNGGFFSFALTSPVEAQLQQATGDTVANPENAPSSIDDTGEEEVLNPEDPSGDVDMNDGSAPTSSSRKRGRSTSGREEPPEPRKSQRISNREHTMDFSGMTISHSRKGPSKGPGATRATAIVLDSDEEVPFVKKTPKVAPKKQANGYGEDKECKDEATTHTFEVCVYVACGMEVEKRIEKVSFKTWSTMTEDLETLEYCFVESKDVDDVVHVFSRARWDSMSPRDQRLAFSQKPVMVVGKSASGPLPGFKLMSDSKPLARYTDLREPRQMHNMKIPVRDGDFKERLKHITLRRLCELATDGTDRAINGLDVPMYSGQVPASGAFELDDGSQLKDIVNHHGHKWEVPWPFGLNHWGLASTENSYSTMHMDPNGGSTSVQIAGDSGEKVWFTGRVIANETFVTNTGWIKESIRWQACVLRAGDELYMPGATPHTVVTTKPTIAVGTHFFSSVTFSHTLLGMVYEHYLGRLVTNTSHPSFPIVLFKMAAEYLRLLRENDRSSLPDDKQLAYLCIAVLHAVNLHPDLPVDNPEPSVKDDYAYQVDATFGRRSVKSLMKHLKDDVSFTSAMRMAVNDFMHCVNTASASAPGSEHIELHQRLVQFLDIA